MYKIAVRSSMLRKYSLVSILIVTVFSILFFNINTMQTYANFASTITVQEDVEVRTYLLELLAGGEELGTAAEYFYIQPSNRKNYTLLSNTIEENGKNYYNIKILPEIDGNFFFPSIGSWELTFDSNNEFIRAIYYFQSSYDYRVHISADIESSIIALFIKDRWIYSRKKIPITARNILKMPLQRFFESTYQLLYWDWLFPTEKFQQVNLRSRNFSEYLSRNLKDAREERMDNLLNKYAPINEMEKNMVLSNRIKNEREYFERVLNQMLLYVGSKKVYGGLFDPSDNNRKPIAPSSDRYNQVYLNNINSFLQQYPDFYTSIKEIQLPFEVEQKRNLKSLFSEMYFTTSKYPGLMYVVSIGRSQRVGEEDIYLTIGNELLIPYFNLDGTFSIYGAEYIQQYLDEEAKEENSGIIYFIDNLLIFRVPNRYEGNN